MTVLNTVTVSLVLLIIVMFSVLVFGGESVQAEMF